MDSMKALSYNVQEVKNDVLTKVKDANFVNSLNGKLAGVSIQRSASGVQDGDYLVAKTKGAFAAFAAAKEDGIILTTETLSASKLIRPRIQS